MRIFITVITVVTFCLFASFVSQSAYSKWYEFVLVDGNIRLFDEEEPEEWYIDNHTARMQKQYLKDFFIGEIAEDLVEQGIEYLNPEAKRDVTSTLNNVLRQFSHLDDDDHIFINRYP